MIYFNLLHSRHVQERRYEYRLWLGVFLMALLVSFCGSLWLKSRPSLWKPRPRIEGPRSELLDELVEKVETSWEEFFSGIVQGPLLQETERLAFRENIDVANLILKYQLSYEELNVVGERWNNRYQHRIPIPVMTEKEFSERALARAEDYSRLLRTTKGRLAKVLKISSEIDGVLGDLKAREARSPASAVLRAESQK
jgi:hypothetical protein